MLKNEKKKNLLQTEIWTLFDKIFYDKSETHVDEENALETVYFLQLSADAPKEKTCNIW